MTHTPSGPPRAARVRMGLLVGLGGALYTFVVLWLSQALAADLNDSRLMERGAGGALMVGLAWLFLGGLLWLGLTLLWPRRVRPLMLLGVWLAAYLLLWALGIVLGGVHLLVYLAAWLLAGLLGAQFAADLQPQPAPPRSRAAQPAVVETSEFGRVPRKTVVLLNRFVQQARTWVLSRLPADTPKELRDWTLRAVLDCMLRDWWENGNDEPLDQLHIDDLRGFVALALEVSTGQTASGELLRQPLRQAIYRAALRALLDDWLHNWNSNGDDGPPRRR